VSTDGDIRTAPHTGTPPMEPDSDNSDERQGADAPGPVQLRKSVALWLCEMLASDCLEP
jgi:hypothetical protein